MKLLSVSKFRSINSAYLKAMKEAEFVVLTKNGNHEISHVLMPFKLFAQMQELYHAKPALLCVCELPYVVEGTCTVCLRPASTPDTNT